MPAPTASEPIDVVDENDHVVGTSRRGSVLERGLNFRTAHVFLRAPENGLVLQRLAPDRDRHGGRWGSSVAAYLHSGETYRQAADRRLREELGTTAILTDLGSVAVQDEKSTKFVTLFAGGPVDDQILVDRDHIAELRPWSAAEIDSALRADPETFTPTFRTLYARFRQTPTT
ncbi:NUDIX domain-containing protein [Patulibacter sp. NPDC049589]|uniref:NUDIX hydrolase n=1 Tax=Patulibacter sp. NPDC049589 TaxID=3154731 RepID=UPI003432B669